MVLLNLKRLTIYKEFWLIRQNSEGKFAEHYTVGAGRFKSVVLPDD